MFYNIIYKYIHTALKIFTYILVNRYACNALSLRSVITPF
jgi:hypothetical protein